MKAYASMGNAILFSSHALNTVAKICDRVVLIRKGKRVDELVMSEFADRTDFDFEEYFLSNEGQD